MTFLDEPCEIHDRGLTDVDDDLCCYHSGHVGRSHTLHLPVTEPKLLLTSNQRLHWAVKAKRTKHWRELAAVVTRPHKPDDQLGLARVTVTLTWPTRRDRDPANWEPTAKALIDGMTDAGWWPDDNSKHVVGPDMRADPERGPHSIRIDIEEIT